MDLCSSNPSYSTFDCIFGHEASASLYALPCGEGRLAIVLVRHAGVFLPRAPGEPFSSVTSDGLSPSDEAGDITEVQGSLQLNRC